jgi:hypothetical protein
LQPLLQPIGGLKSTVQNPVYQGHAVPLLVVGLGVPIFPNKNIPSQGFIITMQDIHEGANFLVSALCFGHLGSIPLT